MEENKGTGKSMTPGQKKILAAALAVTGLIVVVYLGLCLYVGAARTILPGVYAGGTKLGGATQEQACHMLKDWFVGRYSDVEYTLTYGDNVARLDGTLVCLDAEAVARQAWQIGRSESFLKRGAVILAQFVGRDVVVDCPVQFSREGGAALDAALDQLSVGESVALVESVWSSDGHVLTVTKGITGTTVDREQTCALLLQAVQNQGNQEVKAPAAATPPHPLDIQLIYDQLYAQAQDAYVETERYTVIPHVVGIDFDVEQVRTRFEAMAEGETMQVELVRTMPRMTTERLNKLLFADVLGECTTNIGGTENRLSNVKVAAKAIDGRVLMPGDTFSYDQTLGPRTTANGYLPAPAYIGGKTVDDVGGGICQDSSTLYLAALRANLEIVERTNHMYTVGYVPDGLDATVAYNAIDFKFKNNTEYPIRIEARVSGRKMIVRLHGTKTDDFTVKMETKTLSTTPYETIYKPDDSVAPGKTVVETTAYTGRKVQVYRCVYDEQGKLIGRTLESNNNYRHRDKVILYHPADAQKLGLIGADGQVHTTVQPVTPKPVEPEPSTPAVTTPETQQPEQPQPTEPEQEQPVEPDPVQPQEPSQPEVPESPAENVPGRIPEPPPSDVVDVEPDRGCPGETVAEMSRR